MKKVIIVLAIFLTHSLNAQMVPDMSFYKMLDPRYGATTSEEKLEFVCVFDGVRSH